MAALKYSRQRESIKEFLMTRKDHPTADVVYENVRKIYPNISLGTVYRNFPCCLNSVKFRNYPTLAVQIILTGALLRTATSCVKNVDRFWTWKQKI